MEEIKNVDYLAAAVGETGMAWGHVQRALLHCRRTRRRALHNLVLDLNRIGVELTDIEDQLRIIFETAKGDQPDH